MLHSRDGEVLRQDGERIDQEFVLSVNLLLDLFLRTVLFTEETGTGLNGFLVDAGSRRHHTGRIPLYLDARSAHRQLTGLYAPQILITLTGSLPLLQLTVEETLQRRVGHQFLLALIHLLTGQYLQRAQTVFIEVVGIDLIDTESSVTVAAPTPTEIEFSIDASDTVMA